MKATQIGLVLLLGGLAACASAKDSAATSAGELDSAGDLDAAEIAELRSVGFADDEIQAVDESVAISKLLGVQSFVAEQNDGNSAPESAVRRESHGKAHACLRAKVDVTTDGPGVFRSGASYPAWVRISNGGAYQRDDKATHISRGFAIKLLGVDATPTGTHDFLFITSPRFFIHDIRHYPGFLKSTGNGRVGFFWNLLTNMSWEEQAVIVHRLTLKVANLLEAPGYSAVPYSYGGETVKYALAPCGMGAPPTTPDSQSPPSGAGPDYLADAMNATLASADPASGVCYGFYVQRPRNDDDDPIDNPTTAWGGGFDRVATLTFPYGQHAGGVADYRTNDGECERMAFDPFNTTDESRPVGKTNWTRKIVYAKLAHFRRVDLPQIYARWLANRDDASIPTEFKRELAKLRAPEAVNPTVRDTAQPGVDDGFRALGIVQ